MRKAGVLREEGTSMLEMVIVLPVLLLMLFALAEFGLAFGRWITINNAAREGAREAILFRSDCVVAQVEADVRAQVQTYTGTLGLSVPDSDITVTGVCGGAGSDSAVTLTVPFNFQVLPGIAPSLGTSLDLVGASVMRNEG